MSAELFSFISLGGIGESGFNSYLFTVNDYKFLVDFGIAMPTPFMPSTSTIVPDVESMKELFRNIKAIIFTHGHEDHIGAFHYFREFFKVPVVASPLTLELINIKLKELNKETIKDYILIEGSNPKAKLDKLTINFFKTKHSIPQSYGLYFKTKLGEIVFTSDFKDIYNLSKIPENPFILFFDATNSEIKENKEELDVNRNIERLFKETKGAIIVSTFSTNLERIEKIINLSKKYKRRIFVSGKNLEKSIQIGKKLKIFKEFYIEDFNKINRFDRDEILILTTGTQGERYSSLNFISMGNFKGFKIKEGDTVIISSSIIPRNEIYIYDMINRLSEKGAMVYYAKTDDIHSSGHASLKELSKVLSHFNPDYIVPIHGEHRQLNMARRFIFSKKRNLEILKPNPGDEYLFKSKREFIIKKHNIKKLYIDEDTNDFISIDVIKERKKLSESGIIIVNIGKEISFTTYGFIDNDSEIFSSLKDYTGSKIRSYKLNDFTNQDIIHYIEKDIKSFIKKKFNKKPYIVINLSEA
ncbi:MAG: ribonuclease J [Proteobacteria bacterium]|nr:ribonuclease J [Pseudomonadota bacterium]